MQNEDALDQVLQIEHGEEKKRDGFKGETMIVLQTEAFSDYAEHTLVKRMYLTDVGFFPKAALEKHWNV